MMSLHEAVRLPVFDPSSCVIFSKIFIRLKLDSHPFLFCMYHSVPPSPLFTDMKVYQKNRNADVIALLQEMISLYKHLHARKEELNSITKIKHVSTLLYRSILL